MHVHPFQGRPGPRVRTLFVSDTHLGWKRARAQGFLQFLSTFEPDTLFLVGDIVDGRKLKRNWHWTTVETDILHRLLELADRGTRILYTPGNHDAFLRRFAGDYGFVTIANQFIHTTADSRRFLVTHGDRFDTVENGAEWLSVLASIGYDVLLLPDVLLDRIRGTHRRGRYLIGSAIKRGVKAIVRYISSFEDRLVQEARKYDCDGIVCGHIHTPTLTRDSRITYCNTGDWVENCTAMIEDDDGTLRIVRWSADGLVTLYDESEIRLQLPDLTSPDTQPVPDSAEIPVFAGSAEAYVA